MFKLLFSLWSCPREVGFYLSTFFVTLCFQSPRDLQATFPSAGLSCDSSVKGTKEEGKQTDVIPNQQFLYSAG